MEFSRAIGRLMRLKQKEPTMRSSITSPLAAAPANQKSASSSTPEDALSLAISRGNDALHEGRYTRAAEIFDQTMHRIDRLLSLHASWLLREQEATAPHRKVLASLAQSLIQLTHLSDLLLRCQARNRLASHLADALRKRQLRDDLAAWATGQKEISALLTHEQHQLRDIISAHPNDASAHFRLALLHRAAGDFASAAQEFRRVLLIQPHHSASALRLAAILLEQQNPDQAVTVLKKMENVPAPHLQRYYALALAAEDEDLFAHALTRTEQTQTPASCIRSNLALALTEMGLPPAPNHDPLNAPVPICPVP
jgi:tetratricopeptide (TPR) repeat protein